jgi:hypothetical protein
MIIPGFLRLYPGHKDSTIAIALRTVALRRRTDRVQRLDEPCLAKLNERTGCEQMARRSIRQYSGVMVHDEEARDVAELAELLKKRRLSNFALTQRGIFREKVPWFLYPSARHYQMGRGCIW